METYSCVQRGAENFTSFVYGGCPVVLQSHEFSSEGSVSVFCAASRLKVNIDKSRAMCSKNVSRRMGDNFMNISSIDFNIWAFHLFKGEPLGLLLSHHTKNSSSLIFMERLVVE